MWAFLLDFKKMERLDEIKIGMYKLVILGTYLRCLKDVSLGIVPEGYDSVERLLKKALPHFSINDQRMYNELIYSASEQVEFLRAVSTAERLYSSKDSRVSAITRFLEDGV